MTDANHPHHFKLRVTVKWKMGRSGACRAAGTCQDQCRFVLVGDPAAAAFPTCLPPHLPSSIFPCLSRGVPLPSPQHPTHAAGPRRTGDRKGGGASRSCLQVFVLQNFTCVAAMPPGTGISRLRTKRAQRSWAFLSRCLFSFPPFLPPAGPPAGQAVPHHGAAPSVAHRISVSHLRFIQTF